MSMSMSMSMVRVGADGWVLRGVRKGHGTLELGERHFMTEGSNGWTSMVATLSNQALYLTLLCSRL